MNKTIDHTHWTIAEGYLPDWRNGPSPELESCGLHVGTARVTLRFWRDASGVTQFDIEAMEGNLAIVRAPPAWRDVFDPMSDVASRFP